MAVIGKPVPRKEGRQKVTGAARYVDDLRFPGLLYGATVRSAVPRGRLAGIHFEGHIPWPEFTVVTAADIPGENAVVLIAKDQPCLADKVINHAEEPVVLLAHHDRYLLEEARRVTVTEKPGWVSVLAPVRDSLGDVVGLVEVVGRTEADEQENVK